MNRITKIAALLSLALVTACGASSEKPPLEGASIGGPFTLTGTDGKPVSDSAFAGRYRLVYFGYTFCPDVCPTDMQRIAKVFRTLDKDDPALAKKLVPIFVTVDPERDTPEVMKQFVSAFDPRIVGLTGDPKAVVQVEKQYAVYSKKQPPGEAGGYLVDHTAVTYLMGPEGKPISFLSEDMTEAEMIAELRKWVK